MWRHYSEHFVCVSVIYSCVSLFEAFRGSRSSKTIYHTVVKADKWFIHEKILTGVWTIDRPMINVRVEDSSATHRERERAVRPACKYRCCAATRAGAKTTPLCDSSWWQQTHRQTLRVHSRQRSALHCDLWQCHTESAHSAAWAYHYRYTIDSSFIPQKTTFSNTCENALHNNCHTLSQFLSWISASTVSLFDFIRRRPFWFLWIYFARWFGPHEGNWNIRDGGLCVGVLQTP